MFCFFGFVLAQGAPLGYLVHTYFFSDQNRGAFFDHLSEMVSLDQIALIYIWLGTSIFFSMFGWVCGAFIEIDVYEMNQYERTLSFFQSFDRLRAHPTHHITLLHY